MDLPTFDLRRIPGEQSLYRAFLYHEHFVLKGGKQLATLKVFLRRAKDLKGLSVGPTLEEAQKYLDKKLGACRITANDARSAHEGVDVEPDALDHANITGIPLKSENYEIALKIANALERAANQAGG